MNFTASDIGASVGWGVNVGPSQFYGTGLNASLTEYLANGSDNFTVGPVVGYTDVIAIGPLVVSGHPLGVTITLHGLTSHAYQFGEQGRPEAIAWQIGVLVDGDLNTSISEGVNTCCTSVRLPDGNYTWAVDASSGYRANPDNGGPIVRGAGGGINVSFQYLPRDGQIVLFEADGARYGVYGLLNGTSRGVPSTAPPSTRPG